MNNDERIRNWQERRGKPADEQPSATAGGGSAPRLTEDVRLEDVRASILDRRRVRWNRSVRRIALFVGGPLVAVMLYAGLVATPLYQGEAVFTVQTSANSATGSNAGLFAFANTSSTIADAFKARAFILSRPMMNYMQQKYGFLDHFGPSKMDPLTRYKAWFGMNRDPFDYYQKRVRVSVDVQEGILRLYVQARTQEDAVKFGNAILRAAEAHVNEASDKISEDQISALTRDVQQAEVQVGDSRRALASVQAQRGELSPEQTATSVYQMISNLELQLAEAERQRDALRGEGLVNSPMLPGLDIRVRELKNQIAEQRGRLANPGGGSLARTVNEFESASSRKEIAQARWQSTLDTLQKAYLQVLQERRYFVIVVNMSSSAYAKVRDYVPIVGPILTFAALLGAVWFAFRRRVGDNWNEAVSGWRSR